MVIGSWYAAARADIVRNELKALAYFGRQDSFYSFSMNAKSACELAKSRPRSPLFFEGDLGIKLDGHRGVAHIGANTHLQDGNPTGELSYSLAICKGAVDQDDHKLLRRYHFDYASKKPTDRQPHPVFHLQYGGEKSRRMSKCDGDLESWLSEPRIVFMPMSLTLLINVVLKEFPDESTSKISEDGEWRNIALDAENKLLRTFYSECSDFLRLEKGRLLFTTDFCYGD